MSSKAIPSFREPRQFGRRKSKPKRGRPVDVTREEAFEDVQNFIEENAGDTFTISGLAKMIDNAEPGMHN